MFLLESTFDGAGTIVENAILMTDAEAGAAGEMVTVSGTGKLTKAAVTALPNAFLIKTTAAGTSVATEYVRVRTEEQIFLADFVNTAANLYVGAKGVCLDATGLNVDAGVGAITSGGKIEILWFDSVKKKARVRFLP